MVISLELKDTTNKDRMIKPKYAVMDNRSWSPQTHNWRSTLSFIKTESGIQDMIAEKSGVYLFKIELLNDYNKWTPCSNITILLQHLYIHRNIWCFFSFLSYNGFCFFIGPELDIIS